ncbi:MAG: L-seryl-tRNA(Sec) selenium transferase [Sphingomonas sp.]
MSDAEGLSARLRALPQVQRLLDLPAARASGVSHVRLVTAIRQCLDEARAALLGGDAGHVAVDADALLDRALAIAAADAAPVLRRAINATGVVIHTNLGRAPLPEAALAAVVEVARGYSNLEYALDEGRRGSRTQGIEPLLCALTGAEAAVAVNNAAAAVLLALSVLAGGGEVIVSRGELVEIGGGFRIPDVIRQGGARLVEVGTTNRTRLADYADAITPDTRVLLKVHQSNYRVTGFTAAVGLDALGRLARERGLLLVQDLGSGAMADLARLGRPHEPTPREALAAGADLVAFSGDKLMGGPQAGLVVGSAAAVDPLRRHPLMRAMRLDKMSLAAIEATLRLYRDPEVAAREVPVLRMLAETAATTRDRAGRLAALLGGWDVEVVASTAYAGGGSLPEEAVASHAVAIAAPEGADALVQRLRDHRPAVIGRIAGGRVLLDMLTVSDDEVPEIAGALEAARR